MRYIRTEDGKIFDLLKDKDAHYVIFKQSDNIKDLFDCYVMQYNKYNTPEIISKIHWPEIERLLKLTKNKCYIYGAIWTERGLIYVATVSVDGEVNIIYAKET